MRFFGWYVAAVLAAYALSASWSLGQAAARVVVVEEHAAQLSTELSAAKARLRDIDVRERCTTRDDDCQPVDEFIW
jgi:hypothetical protein